VSELSLKFLTYRKVELLICLHFPMVANWNKHGGCVTLMWLAAPSSAILVLW